jgi:hypothetical protein
MLLKLKLVIMSLSIVFKSVFPLKRKDGTIKDRFVFEVQGSEKDIAEYKKAQGDFYTEDKKNGKPLYYTDKCAQDGTKLIITEKGKVIADDTEMRKAKSIVAQFGGDLGAEYAKAVANKLAGNNKPEPTEPAE